MKVQGETINLYIESLLSCPWARREVYTIERLQPPGIYVFVVPVQVNGPYIIDTHCSKLLGDPGFLTDKTKVSWGHNKIDAPQFSWKHMKKRGTRQDSMGVYIYFTEHGRI